MATQNNSTAKGGIQPCENTSFMGNWINGRQVNTIQNTIKNKIIVGLGFIRCLRNIVFSKNN